MTNTRMTDPEVLEQRFPVRVEAFAIRQGPVGKGAIGVAMGSSVGCAFSNP